MENHLKKYRLIREYPNSPKLGTIITPTNGYKTTYLNAHKYPEFWEEVVEKDYEILSFISNRTKQIVILNKHNKNQIDEECYLKNEFWDIHSVKRVSDSEVFTIGDMCNPVSTAYKYNKRVITKIWFTNTNSLRLSSENYTLDINGIEHSEMPLFITEDGVHIYKGDEVTWVFSDNSGIAGTRKADAEMYRNLKYFSTKEKAEEYVLMNESKYSINDILASLPNRKCEKYISIKQMIENLKNM